MTNRGKFYSTKRSSQSVAYDPSKIDLGHLSHMYSEDWHLGIIPFNKEKFKIIVTPETAKAGAINLLKRQGYDDTAETAVESFLRETTQLMFLDGESMFEIFKDEKNDKISLTSIDPKTIEFKGSSAIQTIPEQSRYRSKQATIVGSTDSIFKIEIPDWVEGGKGFIDITKSLKLESNRSTIPTKFLGLNNTKQETFFEFDAFHKQSTIDTLKLTKDSGWDMRRTANTSITEYYWIHRALKFRTNQARLREHIIKKVNCELLPKVMTLGLRIDSIELTGLRTYKDLLNLQADLQNGKIGFFEALDLKKD